MHDSEIPGKSFHQVTYCLNSLLSKQFLLMSLVVQIGPNHYKVFELYLVLVTILVPVHVIMTHLQYFNKHVVVSVLVADPEHGFPPYLGLGFVHVRDNVRVCRPSPQVVEHAPQSPAASNVSQPPSTESNED